MTHDDLLKLLGIALYFVGSFAIAVYGESRHG